MNDIRMNPQNPNMHEKVCMSNHTCTHNHMPFYPDHFPVAMAYVPWQKFGRTYDLDQALEIGTIFPELNKPFHGKGGCCK